MQFSRRGMLGGAATLIVAGSAAAQNDPSAIPSFARTGDNIAQDRAFWAQVASHYDVDRSMANLENGYWGIMAKPVLAEYIRQTEMINRQNTAYARTKFGADSDAVVAALAGVAGVDKDEIATAASGCSRSPCRNPPASRPFSMPTPKPYAKRPG
jgi:hypothetical protein